MAVIRVEKTENYTVMSNNHFKERQMSLRAKGLLSLMLSLPDTWDYSVAGLCAICNENEAAIKKTLKELREFGYLTIRKCMPNETDSGRIEYEYTIYEHPRKTREQKQEIEKQGVEKQPLEKQEVEKCPQLNTNESNTKELNTGSINPSIISPGITGGVDRVIDPAAISLIKNQIEYDILADAEDRDLLDTVVRCIAELYAANGPQEISGYMYSREFLRRRALEITSTHVEYVLNAYKQQHEKIRNVKAYIKTSVFNAPDTMGAFYTNQVRADGLVY